MLVRVLVIMLLALQPLVGLMGPASNCGTGNAPGHAAAIEPSCCGEDGASCCGSDEGSAAGPACQCSAGLCASVLGIECGSCGCEPDRPAAPAAPSGPDSRVPALVAVFPVSLPPLPEPDVLTDERVGDAPALSWLARADSAGDRRALLCSLTT